MKNVSNSTKAPDLGEASWNLSTAKGLLEALSDEFDIMEGSVVSYQSNRNEKMLQSWHTVRIAHFIHGWRY